MPAITQRLPVDADCVEDMERIIHWRLRHQMAFIWEVETSVVEPLLPRGINPLEARPSVSLIFGGFNDYTPGENTIDGAVQPRFFEMTRCIIVQPDLSIRMPIPRFTFFVHRIGSNNPEFVEQEIAKLHLPSYYSRGLEVTVNEAGTELHMADEHGPIQQLRNTHPSPVYRNDEFFGQYYTVQDGQLWFGVWAWRGVVSVHQRSGDAGRLCEHPFFSDVDRPFAADRIGPTYQQLFGRPGQISEQFFFQPRFVRDLNGGDPR